MVEVHSAKEKIVRNKPCKRTAVRETKEERNARLGRRRALSRTGDTTFIPMHNKRVDAAIRAATITAQLSNPLLSAADAQMEGMRAVASRLPARAGCRYRVRPSKSDDASYRNGGSITGDGSRAKKARRA